MIAPPPPLIPIMSFASSSSPLPSNPLKALITSPNYALKYPPDTPIRSLLSAASSVFSPGELSAELERLTFHWVDSVNDLRLLQHEGMLRELGVSVRLCQWLEDELTAVVPAAGVESRITPSSSFSSASFPAASSSSAAIQPRLLLYHSDQDKEGLLYFLGTRGHSAPYTNPALLDLVRVTCIGTMKDSVPIQAVTGRDLVRCVTLADKEAWIQLELVSVWLRPSHYTLRHYSSWDTECVRNWKLRASVDGRQWIDLMEHNNDESINGIGATHTWPISLEGLPSIANVSPPVQHCYRFFQLRLTGPNSNNHVYLACSGIELYGAMWTNDQYQAVAAQQPSDGFGAVNGWHVPDVEMRASPVSSPPTSASFSTSSPFSPSSSLTFSPSSAGQHFVYQHDLDHNGVLYAIATHNHTQPWRNPAEAHLVSLSSSPLLEASAPLSSVVGPDVVRCVTQPRQGSWIAIDLLDKSLLLTAYTLRHYASWDTEALRHWRLEGSVDGERWTLLREHVNDESLNSKGKAVTWMIDVNVPGCARAYRMFRVTQTGENSNKHHYLACSGWELYGQLYAADGHSAYVWPSLSSPAVASASSSSDFAQPMPSSFSSSTFTFTPQHDFDENGVLHHIATSASFTAWRNPHLAGLVTASASSLSDDSVGIEALVGHEVVRLVTQNIPQSWLAIDLRNRLLRMTHYTLRHYSSWDTECLRNWRLEGRLPATEDWQLIREHHNDDSLNGKGATHTWTVRTTQWYNQFRIVQTAENSNRHHYLACSGWEMYGEMRESEERNGREPMELSAAGDPTAMLISPLPRPQPQPQPQPQQQQQPFYQPAVPSPASQKRSSPSQSRSQRDSFTFTSPHPPAPLSAAHSIFDSPASADVPPTSIPATTVPVATRSSSSSPSFDSIPFPSLPSFPSAEFSFPSPPALPTVSSSAVAPFPASPFDAVSAVPALCYDWADNEKGQFLALLPSASSIVRNLGSSDKWQMVRSVQSFSSTLGSVQRIGIRIVVDPATSNTWRFILGVVPASLDCGGPKQWVGTGGSWGYIAGTGGKCHVSAKSEEYGEKYGDGDVVGVEMDFERRELRFYRNGVSQGVAYADLTGPVHVAASLTAQDSMVALVPWEGKVEETDKSEAAMTAKLAAQAARPPLAVSSAPSATIRPSLHHSQSAISPDSMHSTQVIQPSFHRASTLPSPILAPHLSSSWDPNNKSSFLVLDPTNPAIVTNSGSSEKWQIVRSLAPLPANPHHQQATTTHAFQVEVLAAPHTPNSWQGIVGVVPASLTCGGSKQWVGAGGSWGYIGGTGGKCWTEPKSKEYGEAWGAVGDVIECRLHVDAAGVGALEFLKNGRSQGIAFQGVTTPVHAAVSLTATGASVRLTMLS